MDGDRVDGHSGDGEAPSAGSNESAAPPPPPPPPQQPPQIVYNVVQPGQGNGLAVAALVCGIVGSVLFFSVWGGIILGVLAVVFGAVGRSKAKQGAPNGGLAIAGLVLGILALISSFLFLALVVSVAENTQDKFDEIEFCLNNPDAPTCS